MHYEYGMSTASSSGHRLFLFCGRRTDRIKALYYTGDGYVLLYKRLSKLYTVMNDVERRQLIEALIAEIQIYKERQPNGQWLKAIKFRLPIIERDMDLSLDNGNHVETVICLSPHRP